MKRLVELAKVVQRGLEAQELLLELLMDDPSHLHGVRDRAPQKKLARMANVGQEYISMVENCDFRKISPKKLVRIILAYAKYNGDL